MAISVWARLRREISAHKPAEGAPPGSRPVPYRGILSKSYSNVSRGLSFQIDAPAHVPPRIGNFAMDDFEPRPRVTATEALVVEALLDGFIRY